MNRERVDWRRLVALVSTLPPGSRIWRALYGPAADWTTGDELLAQVAELVDVGNYYLFQAFRKRNKHGDPEGPDRPPPHTIRRPDTTALRAAAPPAPEPEPADGGPVSMSDPAAVRFFGAVARYSPAESSTAD